MRLASLSPIALMAVFAISAPAYAGGTIKVARSAEVAADAGKTWDTVKDFGALEKWHPAIEKTEIKSGTDNKPGAVRLLSLKGGGNITEKLTAYSDKGRSMNYEIVDGPLPVVGYKSTISVKAHGKGKSTLVWTSTFKAKDGTSDADAKKVIEGVYDAGLDNLKKQLGS